MRREFVLLLIGFLGCSQVMAADPKPPPSWIDGTIHFIGSVVSAACTISPTSKALVVPMGRVTTKQVIGRSMGSEIASSKSDFDLVLEECDTTIVKRVRVGFSGDISPPGMNAAWLRIGRSMGKPATGMALVIKDSTGQTLAINENFSALQPVTLDKGSNVLRFTATYVANGQPVASGNASAISQFTVNYE